MSITVRLWSKEDLEAIKEGKDKFLMTVFMNAKNFSNVEMKVYPYKARRTFQVGFNDESEPVTVYAADLQSLKKFLQAEYHAENIVSVDEIIIIRVEHDIKLI